MGIIISNVKIADALHDAMGTGAQREGEGGASTFAGAFGARLKLWRSHLRVTQARFSESTGIHIGMLKKYEAGRSAPSSEGLAAIAKTGANVNWLLTGDGDMYGEKSVVRQGDDVFVVLDSEDLHPPIDASTDKYVSEVFRHLIHCMRYAGHLPWLPRNVTRRELHRLTLEATGLLRHAARHEQTRLGALMLSQDTVNAALLLAWRQVEMEPA